MQQMKPNVLPSKTEELKRRRVFHQRLLPQLKVSLAYDAPEWGVNLFATNSYLSSKFRSCL